MKENERHRLDQLLDLLATEVAERLERRSETSPPPGGAASGPTPERAGRELSAPEPEAPVEASVAHRVAEPTPERRAAKEDGPEEEDGSEPDVGVRPEETGDSMEDPVPSHTARLLGRLAIGLLALVVLINIPINRHGTTLATAMPDNRALVIRDGLVVKEEDDPEIYVYENGEFRWMSSLDAFEFRGYTWEDVHVVEDGFLDDYAIGAPIHVLLKCEGSPHIYRVEGEEKRWIVDLEAFEAAGHVWDDVQFVPCAYLRNLPNGETIPPGHGPPPEP